MLEATKKEYQMNQVKSILALLIATMAFSSGCDRKASDEIDFGTVKNSTYQNDYFGLSIQVPDDWSIQDQESQKRLMDLGGKVIAGEDKILSAVLKASELQTVNLLAAFKHPIGAPVPYNPSIMCIAERIRNMPGIKRGKDYHFHSKKFLQSSHLSVSFPREVFTEQLDGKDFDIMPLEMSIAGLTVQQKQYVAITKGYALVIIASYTSDEEEADLNKILQSVRFQK